MPAGDVYRVGIIADQNGVNVENVMYFKQQDADGAEDAGLQLYNGVYEICAADLWPNLTANIHFNTITVKKVSPIPAQTRVFPFAAVPGAAPAPGIGTGANATVSTYTTTYSKRGRGRIRVPGIPSSAVANSNLTLSFITTLNTWLTHILGIWSATGSAIHWAGYVWSSIDATARAVIAAKVHPNVRSLRSRRK